MLLACSSLVVVVVVEIEWRRYLGSSSSTCLVEQQWAGQYRREAVEARVQKQVSPFSLRTNSIRV